ncbi:MAG: ABC-F family ATP-binding cassette domain-containing protein [Planctomycetes bacterium]|nr:ABC-F family ATP-binding cassette domain-containing protein [Planctomycetota bacterium]
MALVSVANLVLSIGDRRLLDGVNLTINAGERVGFVGRNGCGKSTLLKLIAGLTPLKPETGQVQVTRGVNVGYLTQDPTLDLELTLREEADTAFEELHKLHEELDKLTHDMGTAQGDELDKLLKRYEQVEHKIQSSGGYNVDHQIDATLHGLGLTDEFFGVKVKDLSGGQKGRLALAKLLLWHPDVLLLDEPTNHLDIAGREWLERYLHDYTGAVLLVSHDRWLLNNVVSRIVELQQGRIAEYPGNYEQFREQRALRFMTQQRMFEKQQERIKSEQAFIDRYRAGQRAAQAKGREKRLDRLVRDDLLERPVELNELSITLRPAARCGDLVCTADGISKGYENKPLFRNLHMVFKRGDRLGIIGPNGAGKSTLIRVLLGETEPDSGTVRVGPSVNVGHYKQTQEHLNLDHTVIDYLRPFTKTETEQEARDIAGAFLFSGDQQDKRMSVFSGGERSRAVLAGLMIKGHNVLVLDEPTNHLDISSAERLEEALGQYTLKQDGYGENQPGGGTLILITHDRMLLEQLVDQLLVFDGHGNVRHFIGKYSEYVAAQQAAANPGASQEAKAPEKKQEKKQEKSPAPQQSSASSGGRGGKHDKSSHAGGALSKMNQQALEAKIVECETKLAEVDRELANPDVYRDPIRVKKLQERRAKAAEELGPLEEEWARRAEEQ